MTTADVPVAPFATPPNAPQLGSSQLIDTNGDWLVAAPTMTPAGPYGYQRLPAACPLVTPLSALACA
jgi:hypothetical protein